MINWVYFPKSSPPPEFGLRIVAIFEELGDVIDSSTRTEQHSDAVMARLRPGLEKLGFRVEKGKSSDDKIIVPVLFGRKGKVLKCFNADAHAATKGWVLEVEAGCPHAFKNVEIRTEAGRRVDQHHRRRRLWL